MSLAKRLTAKSGHSSIRSLFLGAGSIVEHCSENCA